jgi:hypothetical protein
MLFSPIALSANIDGHQMPDQLPAAEAQLVLNGAGLRDKFMIDLYVGGLYLPKKSSDAAAIINADEAMALRLLIVSSRITSENMTEATLEGFQNSLGSKLAAMQPRIDQFMLSFKEPIKEGDVFEMLYLPGSGVVISKSGKPLNKSKDWTSRQRCLVSGWARSPHRKASSRRCSASNHVEGAPCDAPSSCMAAGYFFSSSAAFSTPSLRSSAASRIFSWDRLSRASFILSLICSVVLVGFCSQALSVNSSGSAKSKLVSRI